MKKDLSITAESFEALLTWLDPHREAAARKYETIRTGLIRIFVSHGHSDAESLADTVIDRVISRLPDIRDNYAGERERYFYGVARNILLEARRKKEVTVKVFPEIISRNHERNDVQECLSECLRLLTPDKRELMLDYYLYEKGEKVTHHKRLAGERGMTENALRGQVHRLRVSLRKCVLNCLKAPATKTKGAPQGISK